MSNNQMNQKEIDISVLGMAFEISHKSPSGLIHKRSNGSKKAGSNAGCINKGGYYLVTYKKRAYSAHRIIWALHNGRDPIGWCVDHIDGNPINNNPSNLRLATMEQNNANARMQKRNKSGVKGMYILKSPGHTTILECSVGIKNNKHVRRFKLNEMDEAKKWLEDTRIALHGEFHNHG